MVLRMAARRFALPLGMEPQSILQRAGESVQGSVKGFVGFRKFFSEDYFWNKANIGPFFLVLLFTPQIYRSVKEMYWTRQLRKLNRQEIVADRFDWLHQEMIRDEVDATLLATHYGPVEIGPSKP